MGIHFSTAPGNIRAPIIAVFANALPLRFSTFGHHTCIVRLVKGRGQRGAELEERNAGMRMRRAAAEARRGGRRRRAVLRALQLVVLESAGRDKEDRRLPQTISGDQVPTVQIHVRIADEAVSSRRVGVAAALRLFARCTLRLGCTFFSIFPKGL